jgi:hypothetical protein
VIHPLKTYDELWRRWRNQIVTTTDGGTPTIRIHLLNGILAGTLASPSFQTGLNTYIQLIGENSAVLLAGNLDGVGGFIAQNPGVPAPGGTPCQINVGATVWKPFIGERIRFTAAGSVATIMKDLGGGVAMISQPNVQTDFVLLPTPTDPANGAAFVVEQLTAVTQVGDTFFVPEPAANTTSFSAQFHMKDLLIQVGNGNIWEPHVQGQVCLVLYQCKIEKQTILTTNVLALSCSSTRRINAEGGAWYGGGVLELNSTDQFAFIASARQGWFSTSNTSLRGPLDFSAYIRLGAVVFRGSQIASNFAVFDVPATGAGVNPGGHAVWVGGGPGMQKASQGFVGQRNGPIFGTGSAGAGIRIGSSSKMAYPAGAGLVLPNITGAVDFQLGDSAVGFFFSAAGAYGPVGAPIVLSWANLTAAQVAGFGGSAFWPAQDAAIVAGPQT